MRRAVGPIPALLRCGSRADGQSKSYRALEHDPFGKVLLVEGDGSLMIHVQELDTIRRQGIKMLMAIMNDGGYGAEVHKFRSRTTRWLGAP